MAQLSHCGELVAEFRDYFAGHWTAVVLSGLECLGGISVKPSLMTKIAAFCSPTYIPNNMYYV